MHIIFSAVVDTLGRNYWLGRTGYQFETFQLRLVVAGRLFRVWQRVTWYFYRVLRCLILLHSKSVKSDIRILEYIVFNFFGTEWLIAALLLAMLFRYYLYFFVAIVLWEIIVIILIDEIYITAFFAICIIAIAIATPSLHNVIRWAEVFESFCGRNYLFGWLVPATELGLNHTSFKGILENAAIVIDIIDVSVAALLPILAILLHNRVFISTKATVLICSYRSQNLTLLSILNIAIFTWIAMKWA